MQTRIKNIETCSAGKFARQKLESSYGNSQKSSIFNLINLSLVVTAMGIALVQATKGIALKTENFHRKVLDLFRRNETLPCPHHAEEKS